jgi:thiamine monophosphate synthase
MGGVTAEKASHLIGTGAAGLAAIDGLSGTVAD